MQYIDSHGYHISRYTLGTVQLGCRYGIANKTGKPDRAEDFKILDAAVDAGINTFDTAPAYGNSEEVLGEYFSSRPNRQPILVTKFAVDPADAASAGVVERQIHASVENSLKRLRVSRIPLLMLHSARDMTAYGSIVADTLRKLKSDGTIGLAGVSVYEIDSARELLRQEIYDAIQAPINILDTRWNRSGILRELRDARIIFCARSVFLQGLLLLRPEELPGKLRAANPYLQQLNTLAKKAGMTTAQLAFTYVRDLHGVATLVIGSETPEQVKQNISLMEAPTLSEDIREEALSIFDEVPAYILNPSNWNT